VQDIERNASAPLPVLDSEQGEGSGAMVPVEGKPPQQRDLLLALAGHIVRD
jgi:hypothetical protein